MRRKVVFEYDALASWQSNDKFKKIIKEVRILTMTF